MDYLQSVYNSFKLFTIILQIKSMTNQFLRDKRFQPLTD